MKKIGVLIISLLLIISTPIYIFRYPLMIKYYPIMAEKVIAKEIVYDDQKYLLSSILVAQNENIELLAIDFRPQERHKLYLLQRPGIFDLSLKKFGLSMKNTGLPR